MSIEKRIALTFFGAMGCVLAGLVSIGIEAFMGWRPFGPLLIFWLGAALLLGAAMLVQIVIDTAGADLG